MISTKQMNESKRKTVICKIFLSWKLWLCSRFLYRGWACFTVRFNPATRFTSVITVITNPTSIQWGGGQYHYTSESSVCHTIHHTNRSFHYTMELRVITLYVVPVRGLASLSERTRLIILRELVLTTAADLSHHITGFISLCQRTHFIIPLDSSHHTTVLVSSYQDTNLIIPKKWIKWTHHWTYNTNTLISSLLQDSSWGWTHPTSRLVIMIWLIIPHQTHHEHPTHSGEITCISVECSVGSFHGV